MFVSQHVMMLQMPPCMIYYTWQGEEIHLSIWSAHEACGRTMASMATCSL